MAKIQSPSMHFLLQCFVFAVERDLSVAVMVRFSNGKIIHAATKRLSSSATISDAHDVLASHDWNAVFSVFFVICLFVVHLIVHIM